MSLEYVPQCARCGAEYVSLPVGQLPPDWQRELNPEGRIYCPDCQQTILDAEITG